MLNLYGTKRFGRHLHGLGKSGTPHALPGCRVDPVTLVRNRKPRRGDTGVFRPDDQDWGDLIAADTKHIGARPSALPWRDVYNLSDHAAIGSIRCGSLFLTLPTRGLIGQQIISPEG